MHDERRERTRHARWWSKWIESRSFVRQGTMVTDSHACHVARPITCRPERDDASGKRSSEYNWIEFVSPIVVQWNEWMLHVSYESERAMSGTWEGKVHSRVTSTIEDANQRWMACTMKSAVSNWFRNRCLTLENVARCDQREASLELHTTWLEVVYRMRVRSVTRTRIVFSSLVTRFNLFDTSKNSMGRQLLLLQCSTMVCLFCCFKLEHQQNETRKINESILLLWFLYRVRWSCPSV